VELVGISALPILEFQEYYTPHCKTSERAKAWDGFSRTAPVIGPTHVDVTEGGKKLRWGVRLWTIAVATFKSVTASFLLPIAV
jgi:hypothetical protein